MFFRKFDGNSIMTSSRKQDFQSSRPLLVSVRTTKLVILEVTVFCGLFWDLFALRPPSASDTNFKWALIKTGIATTGVLFTRCV